MLPVSLKMLGDLIHKAYAPLGLILCPVQTMRLLSGKAGSWFMVAVFMYCAVQSVWTKMCNTKLRVGTGNSELPCVLQ